MLPKYRQSLHEKRRRRTICRELRVALVPFELLNGVCTDAGITRNYASSPVEAVVFVVYVVMLQTECAGC